MKIGDRAVVISEAHTWHPLGTVVEIKAITSVGYYCQNVEGLTCYWYTEKDLKKI